MIGIASWQETVAVVMVLVLVNDEERGRENGRYR